MDKKNTTIGIALLVAGFLWLFLMPRIAPPAPPSPSVGTQGGNPIAPNQAGNAVEAPTSPSNATFAAVSREDREAKVEILENEFVQWRLTEFGGALSNVALKKYPVAKDSPLPYVINEVHSEPALSFVDFPGLDKATRYQLVSASANEVVYKAVYENRIEVTRRYWLPVAGAKGEDPYQLRHETVFKNLTTQTVPLPRAAISVGTSAPLNVRDTGIYLLTGHDTDAKIQFTRRSSLEPGGFLTMFGIGSNVPIPRLESTPGALTWGAVSNQFFTSIITPDQPGVRMITRRVELPPPAGKPTPDIGITGAVQFDVPALAPNGEASLKLGFYAGPKDYRRLSDTSVFKADQDKIMNFGLFKWFAQALLTLMTWMHSWAPNWGVAIVLSTLSLKIVFLYPTLSASKSAKRMQKIQPEMQAVREKYKDNPQKMQAETMALFKKHRVNPAGGCLPVLITMPFFWGFFTMLQSNTNLRFAEFLWAHDLSAPDTVLRLFGSFPVNIMPLILGATMFFQMRLVPQPTVDNAQMKIFKFMPAIMMVFCYSLPAALSLYSTVNGLFTIGQQLVINRMKDEPPASAESRDGGTGKVPGKPGKPLKNVTPKR